MSTDKERTINLKYFSCFNRYCEILEGLEDPLVGPDYYLTDWGRRQLTDAQIAEIVDIFNEKNSLWSTSLSDHCYLNKITDMLHYIYGEREKRDAYACRSASISAKFA